MRPAQPGFEWDMSLRVLTQTPLDRLSVRTDDPTVVADDDVIGPLARVG